MRIRYGPHEKSVMHEHPDAVAMPLTDGQVKFTLSDGKSEVSQMKIGNPMWTPAGKHLPENIGDKPFELILVELNGKADAAPPPGKAAAKGAKKSGR